MRRTRKRGRHRCRPLHALASANPVLVRQATLVSGPPGLAAGSSRVRPGKAVATSPGSVTAPVALTDADPLRSVPARTPGGGFLRRACVRPKGRPPARRLGRVSSIRDRCSDSPMAACASIVDHRSGDPVAQLLRPQAIRGAMLRFGRDPASPSPTAGAAGIPATPFHHLPPFLPSACTIDRTWRCRLPGSSRSPTSSSSADNGKVSRIPSRAKRASFPRLWITGIVTEAERVVVSGSCNRAQKRNVAQPDRSPMEYDHA